MEQWPDEGLSDTTAVLWEWRNAAIQKRISLVMKTKNGKTKLRCNMLTAIKKYSDIVFFSILPSFHGTALWRTIQQETRTGLW